MSYGIKLKLWGNYACFTRPEMKVERVSYDVPTPSAVRGILEAIYWKPSIRWQVDKIHIYKPIRFENIRRNEVGSKIPISNITSAMKKTEKRVELFVEEDRKQRASTVLKDVEYIIEAHIEFKGAEDQNIGKHLDIFNRRTEKGQAHHQPVFGCREFPANFCPVDGDIPEPEHKLNKELGFMLYDMDFSKPEDIQPMFFKAKIKDNCLRVPHLDSEEVKK